MRSSQAFRQPSLGGLLNRLYDRYHRTEYLVSDPLEFPHRFSDPWDREAVALPSALLAYGNVKQIRRSIEDLLARIEALGLSPAQFVRSLGEPAGRKKAEEAFSGFIHRFHQGRDLVSLFVLLERSWKTYGSLGAHFLAHHPENASSITEGLSGLLSDWKAWAREMEREPGLQAGPGFGHLLSSPADGSCCKRWCMLVRWMGREGGAEGELDLGLWTESSPLARGFPRGRALKASQLVIPLDTHTGRISQYLGLTRRKSLNWRAALEITDALKACDAEDPVRYDFALARLGILAQCRSTYREEICSSCDLLPACRFAARSGKRKR